MQTPPSKRVGVKGGEGRGGNLSTLFFSLLQFVEVILWTEMNGATRLFLSEVHESLFGRVLAAHFLEGPLRGYSKITEWKFEAITGL